MNHVTLMGRLTADPEIRYTQSGKAVASFTLAVNRGRSDATDFIPVVAWEKLAEIIGNNLSKGRRTLIEGRLQIRTYEDSDGKKRKVTEVVASNLYFVDNKPEGKTESKGDYESMGAQAFPEEEIPL